MKKKVFSLLIMAGLMLALSGCNVFVGGDSVRGTGDIVARYIDVGDFSAIRVGGSFVVVYRQSPEVALTVIMYENLFDYLEVETRSNTLQVGASRNFDIVNAYRPRLYIYAPYLTAADLSGAVDVTDWDTIEGQRFFLDASGAANVSIGLDVEHLDIDASGAADIDLWGRADIIDIDGSGAVRISANDLVIESGSVNASGASLVIIPTLENVRVNTSGAASVEEAGR